MVDDKWLDCQREVQRLLGRCMLRLQQYERLLKALLAHHELAGPHHQLEALRTARIDVFATNTLGTLVKTLFESYVVVEGADQPVFDEAKMPPDAAAFGFRLSLAMSEERVAQTKDSLKELVSLRNELVHHLIERFDVSIVEGCLAATQFLTESYARIDERFAELKEWAAHAEKARALMASFTQSDAFQNFLVNGIASNGTFDWADAGIVRVLKEASVALAVDGWVLLDDAISWISERHSEQVPEKYGCRSWQEVLHESRFFRLEYRDDATCGKRAWFGLRPVPDWASGGRTDARARTRPS